MVDWANPYGYRARTPYAPGTGYDPNNPFRGRTDEQQLYNRDNPQLVARNFFDALTGGNRSTPFARWLATREAEMLSRFQQVAPVLGPEVQFQDWLDEEQTPQELRYGAPTREGLAREWRERTPEQRGESPWRATRGGW